MGQEHNLATAELETAKQKAQLRDFKLITAGRADDPNSPRGGVCTKDATTCRALRELYTLTVTRRNATTEPVDEASARSIHVESYHGRLQTEHTRGYGAATQPVFQPVWVMLYGRRRSQKPKIADRTPG
eukprot:6777038-Prymnesium_polylepis.1